ncbi:unnamed protein product [Rotaria sp. Silwood1]|nr:unnamed protein product [Rotaria sp. Silwood1]
MYNEPVAINLPLQAANETETKIDEDPPPYQNPQLDFSGGWKNHRFAIFFWIHTIAVILVSIKLGIPVIAPYIKHNAFGKSEQISSNRDIKPLLCGLGGAATVGGLVSFLSFIALQLCAGQLIKCSFFVMIIIQVLFGILLLLVHWPLAIAPGILLLFTLIYFLCVQKRISFAQAHLQAGCAGLHSHPSLILIALVLIIVEFLWFVFWFLMVLGIQHASNNSISIIKINTIRNVNNATTFTVVNTKPIRLMTSTSITDTKIHSINDTTYLTIENSKTRKNTIHSFYEELKRMNRKRTSNPSTEEWYSIYLHRFILFLLLFSWYWGAVTFGNIIHFITACSIGHWWFPIEVSQQYTIGTSIKRAFTTNFGTICFGSFFEAIIKALSSSTKEHRRKSILSCIFGCILQMIDDCIGYLNEWAFIYAALTGQGFVQASRSFLTLFQARGWTAIINDSLVGTTLFMINFVIGVISAVAGGFIAYFMMVESTEQIRFTIIIVLISFFIGLCMSTIITTILKSCVRTIFVCFALNPAALGATHPDHLQSLTKVWHEVYPQEFSDSGYINPYKETMV